MANLEKIAEELSGDVLMVEISTKTKKNLDKLVESIVLQAEILDLKTDYQTKASGVVLESKIDIGRGPIATLIITSGTLKKGDYFVSGLKWGKTRALINDLGKYIDIAAPSSPVEILGINGAAKAGDDFLVLENEKEAKSLCAARLQETQDGKIFNTIYFKMTGNTDDIKISLNRIRFMEDVNNGLEKEKETIVNIIKEDILQTEKKEEEKWQEIEIEWNPEL